MGKHREIRRPPPRIPKHPLMDLDQNMNEIITYADLKLRWRNTNMPSRNHMKLSRKWKVKPARAPRPPPTCLFMNHSRMPYRSAAPMYPPPGSLDAAADVFAIFKSCARLQHKVTVGDIIQTERMHRRDAGDKIVFGTVLFAGGKDFTIIGKPTIPYARIHCTIEQQTLTRELISFYYRAKKRMSRFLRVRQWVTMLRVDRIELNSEMAAENTRVKPKSGKLIDLWANRWLSLRELKSMQDNPQPPQLIESNPAASADSLSTLEYDGFEHQPGSYSRRGLTETYRFTPDPQAPAKKWH